MARGELMMMMMMLDRPKLRFLSLFIYLFIYFHRPGRTWRGRGRPPLAIDLILFFKKYFF